MKPTATLDRHAASAREAVHVAGDPKRFTAGIGDMLDQLAYDHARAAAHIVLEARR